MKCPPTDGHYDDGKNPTAKPCDYHCKTCTGPNHD